MKKTTNYIFAFVCAWTVFACARIEEPQFDEGAEMVEMTITATIADKTDTKTTLEGDLEDGVLQTMWTPDDAIGIGIAGGASNTKFEKFINIQTENSETGIFQGTISQADKYYAIYPHAGNRFQWNGDDHVFIINLPHTQIYKEGSFSSGTAPMIASAAAGEVFEFQNLCGLLALRLKGEERISSITFIAKDANDEQMIISGDFVVKANNPLELLTGENYSAIVRESSKSVTLKCDNPVQLSTSDSTPFYFVLPPATYDKFTLIINTADGKVMMKEGKSPITIERAHAKPTAALQYAETVTVDLSEKGTANCYIIPEAGVYSFDANVMGNGDFGIVDGSYSHTTNPYISPAKVELLWEDKEGLIVGEDYSDGKITFVSTGMEGNAVIAAKDQSGTILWSWHIWCTDQPAEHFYVNSTGEYTVLDRNLGATRADRGNGDEWMEARGLAYQWGRKDPFTPHRKGYEMSTYDYCAYEISNERASIEESIQNPSTLFGVHNSRWMEENANTRLWAPTQKTIYDPCPVGYEVAYSDVWRSFTKSENDEVYNPSAFNVSGIFRNGFYFKYDGVNTTYYPTTWGIGSDGFSHNNDNSCEIWRAESSNDATSNIFQYNYVSTDEYIFFRGERTNEMNEGNMVRCVKEDIDVLVIAKINKASNVTANSAEISGSISTYGNIEILKRGFVIGDTANITIENGEVINKDGNTGIINESLNNLNESTTYYIRSFATTSEGTTYSNVVSFTTPNLDGVINLSSKGTANSYIVIPGYNVYSIDAVKGNSKETVGNIYRADVLWESYNTPNAVTQYSIIESVDIQENKVIFTLPENGKPGNALIAVKDNYGTILWSWHIWVCDFDPEATQQKFVSGAIMMDRNLGALNIIAGDPGNIGLMYQYGRKDPFVGYCYSGTTWAYTYPLEVFKTVSSLTSTNSLDYATQNPCVIIDDSSWNNDANLWKSNKTIYDPCPAGWRVPEHEAWNGEKRSNIYSGEYLYLFYSNALIPYTDYIDSGYIIGNSNVGYYRTTSPNTLSRFHYGWGSDCIHNDGYDADIAAAVRCMKETEINSGGSNEGYGESDDYEW